MNKPNEVEIEILPGGLVKITSGKISLAIHAKIEDAVKRFEEMLGGGNTKITQVPHSHRGTGAHTHGGHGHQH